MSRFLFPALLLSMAFPACALDSEAPNSGESGDERGSKADSLLDGSCEDSCGTKSQTGSCWCDELCEAFGDCCVDLEPVCFPEETKELTFSAPETIGATSFLDADDAWASLAFTADGEMHVFFRGSGSRGTYARENDDFAPVLVSNVGDFMFQGMSISARPGSNTLDLSYIGTELDLVQLELDDGVVVNTHSSDNLHFGDDWRSLGAAANTNAPVLVGGESHGSSGLDFQLLLWEGVGNDAKRTVVARKENTTIAGHAPAVAVDSAGGVHIVYGQRFMGGLAKPRSVRYAYRAPGQAEWQDDFIAGTDDWTGSLTLDSQGNPAVAYYDRNEDGLSRLFVAKRVGGEWNSQEFAFGGRNISLTFDATDRLHVVTRSKARELWYIAEDADGNWFEPQVLDTNFVMANHRMALDFGPDGRLHVLYTDEDTRELRHIVSQD